MALQMNFTDPETGVEYPESYWEISDFEVNTIHGAIDTAVTKVEFAGWYNKAAHDDEKLEFMQKIYELPAGAINFTQTIGDAYDGLYAYALGDSFFATAELV